jgi:hypothetical protein
VYITQQDAPHKDKILSRRSIVIIIIIIIIIISLLPLHSTIIVGKWAKAEIQPREDLEMYAIRNLVSVRALCPYTGIANCLT